MARVSVIMATRDGGATIGRAITGVLAQDFPDFELVIVDDASSSCDVAAIVAGFGDHRIRVLRRERPSGPGPARNLAVEAADGEYIAVIDDDDEWPDPAKLRRQVGFLEDNRSHVLVGCSVVDVVDEDGCILYRYDYPSADEDIRGQMLARNCFVHSAVMYRRDVFVRLGGYQERMLAEDYDLWLRMGMAGKMANLPGTRVCWTMRASSCSGSRRTSLNRAVIEIIRRYRHAYPGYFKALAWAWARLVWGKVFGYRTPRSVAAIRWKD